MSADRYLDGILSDEGLSRDSLDVPCQDDHILSLAQQISRWQGLAPYIGLDDLDEEAIKESGGVEVQRVKMLRRWQQKLGTKATYLYLAKGLASVQRRDLIEQVCDLVRTSPVPSKGEGLEYCLQFLEYSAHSQF